ncbi:MAG: TlpA family protein disulfide reductase [Cyclobacteriaceae bacterium]
MKSSYIFPIILFFVIVSCEPKEEAKTTLISGEITNPEGDIVTFRLKDTTITDTLDANNQFATELPLQEATEIRFGHGDEIAMIYMRPGKAIRLTLNPEMFDETLEFSGDLSDVNNYKAAIVLLQDSLIGGRELYSLEEEDFIKTLDSITAIKLNLLTKLAVADEEFKSFTINNSKWEAASSKLLYERYHPYALGLDSFAVSSDYYSFQSLLDVSDSSNLRYPAFKRYVDGAVELRAAQLDKIQGSEGNNDYGNYLTALNEIVTIKSLKADLLYQLIKYSYLTIGEAHRGEMIEAFNLDNTDAEKGDEVAEIVAKFAKIEKGVTAPDFSFVSIDGDTLGMADFTGKVVYIDVWATWCGPCIAEHPAMEKLQNRFKDTPVAFLAISIDSSPDPWRKMVADRELGGIHLYAPGAWSSKINQDYVINSIPRFILIDQEGKIVDANAARPSGNIGDQIEGLLKSS